VINQQRGQ
jgi:hypothetical protein